MSSQAKAKQAVAKVNEPQSKQTPDFFFQVRCPTKPFRLKGIVFPSSVRGVLTQLDSPAATKYDWTVALAFYRFDGDTPTGTMDGTLLAKRRA